MRPIISTIHTANDSTAMPNSTAKTLLGAATVILPSWAKSIIAVSAKAGIYDPISVSPGDSVVEVESNDLSVMPFQVFPAPIAPLVGNNNQVTAKPEVYQMNASCNGGEQISIYGTASVAPGGATTLYVGANLIVSNMRPVDAKGMLAPQRRAKVGTHTQTGTTAGADVAGTRYNFSGGSHIVELMGLVNDVTPTAAKAFIGHVKFTSNEFDGVSEVKLDLNSPGGSEGTQAMGYIDGTSRLKVDIPVLPGQGQVNIQDYAYFATVSSATGYWQSGIIYE